MGGFSEDTEPMHELFCAKWLYRGFGLPEENTGIVVSNGMIEAIGPIGGLQERYPTAKVHPMCDAISPQPVNAHTHLDLSTVPFKQAPYTEWISHVIAHRQERNLAAAQVGLNHLKNPRIPVLGDIVTQPEVMEYLLTQVETPGVAYWEVIGPRAEDANLLFEQTRSLILQFRQLERPGKMRVGLSPHAAHTVHHTLLKRLAEFAQEVGLPLQIHIAESPEELELFQQGQGPLAESMVRYTGQPVADILGRAPSADLTPISHLKDLGILQAQPTLIHTVQVTEMDVQTIAQTGCTVVTCPRSNEALMCGTFDWNLFLRNNVEIAIGTDSVASGKTLHIEDEIRHIRIQHPHLPLRLLIRAAVKGGYRALKLQTPRLQVGQPSSMLHFWMF